MLAHHRGRTLDWTVGRAEDRVRTTVPTVKRSWTFLTNHALVLIQVWQEPDVTIKTIAERVGITERGAHRIMSSLVEAGYVTRNRVGRRNYYLVREGHQMRHPLSRHQQVGQLLRAMAARPVSSAQGES